MGKGKKKTSRGEKGKGPPRDFCPDLTRHTHRAHARTTRNDFPVELSPPTSDYRRILQNDALVQKASLLVHSAMSIDDRCNACE